MIALYWISLQKHHLLKISYTTMSHLSGSARSATCKIIFVDNRTFKTSTCRIQNDSATTCSSTNNEKVILRRRKLFKVFISSLQAVVELDLLLVWNILQICGKFLLYQWSNYIWWWKVCKIRKGVRLIFFTIFSHSWWLEKFVWHAHLRAFLHVYSLFVFVHHGLGTNIAEASDVRNVFNLRGFSKH